MGGSTWLETYDGTLTLAEVKRKIEDAKHEATHHEGQGVGVNSIYFTEYRGTDLKTRADVESYLDELSKGDGIILRVTDAQIPYNHPELKPLAEAVQAEASTVRRFASELLVRMKSQASKTRGCSNCGSSIAIAFLKPRLMMGDHAPRSTLSCPVCDTDDFCISETDKKKRETLMKSYEKAVSKHDKKKDDIAKKLEKTVWIAAGFGR